MSYILPELNWYSWDRMKIWSFIFICRCCHLEKADKTWFLLYWIIWRSTLEQIEAKSDITFLKKGYLKCLHFYVLIWNIFCINKYYTALCLLKTSVYFVIQRGIHTILDHFIHKTKKVTFFWHFVSDFKWST